ncbi:Transmembrane protease serine 3, partial [Ophiophagus hannah]
MLKIANLEGLWCCICVFEGLIIIPILSPNVNYHQNHQNGLTLKHKLRSIFSCTTDENEVNELSYGKAPLVCKEDFQNAKKSDLGLGCKIPAPFLKPCGICRAQPDYPWKRHRCFKELRAGTPKRLKAPRTDSSLEIASAAKDELPDSNICFCYERIFCIQQAKVDHSENENEEIAAPRCHFLIPLRLLPFILALFLTLIIATAIALSVYFNCNGRFQCRSSFKCIDQTARCDGVFNCKDGEDEYRCVRLSGKRAVLQVFSLGTWRTVCSDGWKENYGNVTCKYLGFSREECISGNHVVPGPGTPRVLLVEMCPCSSNGHGKPAFSFKDITCVGDPSSPDGGLLQQPTVFMRAWSVHVGLVILEESPVNPHLVDKIIYHKNYKPKTMKNDIALIKLATPLALNGLIEPICLPNFGEHFPEGKMCWISGWGATEEGGKWKTNYYCLGISGDTSETMKHAGVPLISNKVCNRGEVYGGIVASSMLCAGFLKGGIDTCQGDSGGPLACKDTNTWKLVGTTSFGVGCAEENKPGVYSRITSFLDWIHEQMEVYSLIVSFPGLSTLY